MWEAIVWIFYNLVPWLWLVTTLIYLIALALIAFSEKDEYKDAWDFMSEIAVVSVVVNIIGFLIVFAVALLTEKIVRAKAEKRQKA